MKQCIDKSTIRPQCQGRIGLGTMVRSIVSSNVQNRKRPHQMPLMTAGPNERAAANGYKTGTHQMQLQAYTHLSNHALVMST